MPTPSISCVYRALHDKHALFRNKHRLSKRCLLCFDVCSGGDREPRDIGLSSTMFPCLPRLYSREKSSERRSNALSTAHPLSAHSRFITL